MVLSNTQRWEVWFRFHSRQKHSQLVRRASAYVSDQRWVVAAKAACNQEHIQVEALNTGK